MARKIRLLFIPFLVVSLVFIGFYTFLNCYRLNLLIGQIGGNIDNAAHIGGELSGFCHPTADRAWTETGTRNRCDRQCR